MKPIGVGIVLLLGIPWTPAGAETHALIMAIGNYSVPGIAPLKGVPQDVTSARDIARRLGVKDANVTVMRDGDLDHSGMRRAFQGLRERIAMNDDVFIYYSGHGSRQLVKDPEERCAEALVTYDGRGYADTDLEASLKALSTKAKKLVVFLDACHSGGVTSRALGNADFTPKYVARSGSEACERPVNIVKRGISNRAPGTGAQNYVYIAAARDNEISLDEASKGGVATQAWRECLAGAARDVDGSGALSAEEIQTCAQQIIDRKLANVKGVTPHHISITGNSRAVLKLNDGAPSSSSTATGAPQPMHVSPAHTLKDILALRDDRRVVTLGSATRLRIGAGRFQLSVTSTHAGYLYVLMAGADGKNFDLLFPNRLDDRNEIAAGQTLRLPREKWEVIASGPPGVTHVLAMVTDAPRDFSGLGMRAAGPFSVLEASSLTAKDIVLVSTSAPAAAKDRCQNQATRGDAECSPAYGAALVIVEEVP